MSDRNIVWHDTLVSPDERARLLSQAGAVVWFTGLSGSGKSTITTRVEAALLQRGLHAFVLDGDNVRHGLCADLGFSAEDRAENIRRVGHVARLMADANVLCLTAFISPLRQDRAAVRALLGPRFIEVHVDTPLAVCEARDPKGLYAKARAGLIPDFTGISAPYEPPDAPELHLPTDGRSPDDCAAAVIAHIQGRGLVP